MLDSKQCCEKVLACGEREGGREGGREIWLGIPYSKIPHSKMLQKSNLFLVLTCGNKGTLKLLSMLGM